MPTILALKIEDASDTQTSDIGNKTHSILNFFDSNGGEVVYELISGVYNTSKTFDGCHSFACVKYTENGKERFMHYNDSSVSKANFEDIRGYGKLFFYRKV